MKILYNQNKVEEIKNIISSKAKFQKVMLLFDDYISNIDIQKIYNSIKEICVYNQCNLKDISEEELNNGYRALIYLCEADNFLKTDFCRNEFINIFCPSDSAILPYCLKENNMVDDGDNFIILDSAKMDAGLVCGCYFNQFINYFKRLFSIKHANIDLQFLSQDITQFNIISMFQNLDKSIQFFDIDIIKKTKIPYSHLVLIDLMVIDAFLLLIRSIKNQSLSIVDIYKADKEDYSLIDKFYALYNNETFVHVVLLNFNSLQTYCNKTKEKILDCLETINLSNIDFESIKNKIKIYTKQDNGIFAYLYLFDLFGV